MGRGIVRFIHITLKKVIDKNEKLVSSAKYSKELRCNCIWIIFNVFYFGDTNVVEFNYFNVLSWPSKRQKW